jgi:aspartate-semialdehyde dehydrogenase
MKSASLPRAAGGRKWPVAVLGATGAVGQTFIRLLDNHPWFELAEVAASERSAGRRYSDAVKWVEGEMPVSVRDMTVRLTTVSEISAPVVFSALDAGVAGEAEAAFASAGRMVLSNARNHRMEADVPLVIAEVNGSHLSLLDAQRSARGWPGSGGIVTNANCAATVIAMAVAPLHEAFGIRRMFVTTMQAVSGAGYPGVPALDIIGNIIPFISGEEEKIELELGKMLGTLSGGGIDHATFPVSAHATRVHVRHGHSACISLELDEEVAVDDALQVLEMWRGDARCVGLPGAPERPLLVHRDADRPQPARDVGLGRGMTVSVGRVRPDPVFHLRMVALGHNTVRGAAGGSVLNAELLATLGQLPATA